MNLCSNSNTLPLIDVHELIGKSLNTINTNFSLVSENTCSENEHLKKIHDTCSILQNQILTLQNELNGSPVAYVLFDKNTNISIQKGVSNINKNSVGKYQIFFSSPITTDYQVYINCVTSLPAKPSISLQNANSLTITIRLPNNGVLVDPEKISLIFFD